MGKILIIIIIVLVIVFVFFFRGPEAGDIVITPTSSPTRTTTVSSPPTSSPTSSVSLTATPKTSFMIQQTPANGGGEILDTTTWVMYTNETEGYRVKMHPWWWWRNYGATTGVGFDRNTLEDREALQAAILIKSVGDVNMVQVPDVRHIYKQENGEYFLIEYQRDDNEYLDIFATMASTFEFTQ